MLKQGIKRCGPAIFGAAKRGLPRIAKACGRVLKSNVSKISGGAIVGTTATYCANKALPVIENAGRDIFTQKHIPTPAPSFWRGKTIGIIVVIGVVIISISGIAMHLLMPKSKKLKGP